MAATEITKEQAKKIAALIKVDITGLEDKFAAMFTETLVKVDILNELDTTDVDGTYQVTGITNVFQKDDESPDSLTKDEVMQNVKDSVKGLIGTKAVFDRE